MCTSGLGLFADEERRETGLEGLEPFGLAGFGRIWGHIGACCPVELFLGKYGEVPGRAKRAQHGGRRAESYRIGGTWAKT